MASEQLDDFTASPQIRALCQCSAELVVALSAADSLIPLWLLFAKDLIGQETVDYCQLEVVQAKKSSKIVSAVIKTVSANLHLFGSLVSVLSESGNTPLVSVGEKLKQYYARELSKETQPKTPCHSHSFHTHPHNPPITPPQQQSPICRYGNHLRAVYRRSELSNPACYKWMRSPGEKFKFINLAVISKQEIKKEEADKIKKETIHGHIDIILKKKAPISIENILQVEQEQSLTCVLIEGAPGIGKSTLAWELCQRWPRGELFQDYSIVLLVTLRDERVQRATCVADLFHHSNKKLQEEVVQEIGETNGKGTLILLEGLDELPKHLLTGYTVFTDLLSGSIFPEATILITSRPSATNTLWQKWWQQISRHIEILGFTEDNIDEYTKSVLPDLQLSGFNTYLSIHPHIKSMMYVPLHCAIATTVYLLCQQSDRPLPSTLTGLYTYLAQTILTQYLQDCPDFKGNEYTLNSFSDLPCNIYAHFKRLCSLAFDGVDKQQLVFCNPPQSLEIPQKFEHLGFMNAVPERLLLFQQSASYSYNFLHLSVQEYLAAYHISLIGHNEQEQILRIVRYGDHRFNMVRFLAGITQLKHLDSKLVKSIVGIKSRPWEMKAVISEYTLEFLYECQDVSILDSNYLIDIDIQANDSVHCLMALGYCIAKSSSKWHVMFTGRDNSGTEALCHSLKETIHPTYSIDHIECRYCSPDFIHNLLLHLPEYALKQIKKICVDNADHAARPLPPRLPELIPRMERLHTLTLNSVCHSSLIELLPVLSRVPTLRNLLVSDGKSTFEMVEDHTIDSLNCTSEFLDKLLPALPQYSIAHVKSLSIDYNNKCGYTYHRQTHPLLSCLPILVPRMYRLSTLTLGNVDLYTSLVKLIPALFSIPALKNVLICDKKNNTFEMKLEAKDISACGINIVNHTPAFLQQLLLALPQPSLALIKSLAINYEREYDFGYEPWECKQRPVSLPPCLPELIPKMETLMSLTVENVLDTSLTNLMPALSKVPTLRSILMSNSRETFKMNLPENFSTDSIETINCTAKFLDQLLPALPQQSVAHIKSLSIYHLYGKHYQRLPSCLPELIPKMERLNTLTLNTVFNTSLIELLISVISKVSTIQNIKLINSSRKEKLYLELPHENILTATIESVNCTSEFLDQLLSALPQQSITHIRLLAIRYDNECRGEERNHTQCQHQPISMPPCFPSLITRMQRLDTLKLIGVYETSMTKLIAVLSSVFTLRNLQISYRKTAFSMKFPSEDFSTGVIESVNCTPTFLNQLLSALPQQSIACIQSLTINYKRQYRYEVEDWWDYLQCQHQPLPIPPCSPALMTRMKRLDTLTLTRVPGTSLTQLIPALFRVPTLKNVTLHKLNSKAITFLCQWLPTCQLEKLILHEEIEALATHMITIVFCNDSIEAIECKLCTIEFINQILPQIPQQIITHVKKLKIHTKTYHCGHSQLLPPYLLELIPKLGRLNTLILRNTSLVRVFTMRHFGSDRDTYFKMQFPVEDLTSGTIESINYSSKILNQLLPALPQQTIAYIKSLTINYESEKGGYGVTRQYVAQSAEPLPPCLLELVPNMKNLHSLSFVTVLDDTLKLLMPLLSIVPITRNLTLSITLADCQSDNGTFTYIKPAEKAASSSKKLCLGFIFPWVSNYDRATECTCTCSSPEIIEQLLQLLPQQHMAQIQAFEINYHTLKPLPLCLAELIPKMKILNTVVLNNVCDTSLTGLMPVLSRVLTLKKLTIRSDAARTNDQLIFPTRVMTITFCNNSIDTIECQNCTTEFIDQVISQAPQQTITHVKELTVRNRSPQPLPCMMKQLHRMERLNSLTLSNVLDTSVTDLLPVLPKVYTMRNLNISTCTEDFEMLFPTKNLLPTGAIKSTLKFIDQFLPQLPRQTLVHIRSLSIKLKHSEAPQSLPSFLLDLLPLMENLESFTCETVLDATLKAVITMLSTATVQKNLTLSITFGRSKNEGTFIYNTMENVYNCTCTSPEMIKQLLQFLPNQHMAHIQTFEVSYSTSEPLPSCLLQLIPRIERLNTLTLKNICDISLTELVPALSKIQGFRNFELHDLKIGWQKTTDCSATINFCNGTIENIKCRYSATEYADHILTGIPWEFMSQVKTLKMNNTKKEKKHMPIVNYRDYEEDEYENVYEDEYEYEHQHIDHSYYVLVPLSTPPCLPELIPRMGKLNTLTLEKILDTSLTKLIPVLFEISGLRNLRLHQLNLQGTALLCQWLSSCLLETLIIGMEGMTMRLTFTNHFVKTIECDYYTAEFIGQILLQMPQQLIAQVKTFAITCNSPSTIYDDEDREFKDIKRPPLPSCLPEQVSRMERLITLTLENVSLHNTALIGQLSALPTLRSLTMHKLSSEGITFFCQRLPACQLETLELPYLSPDHIMMVSRALTTGPSSLKILSIQRSNFTIQSMQAFASMLQQNWSLTEVNISYCNINSDSACCLAEVIIKLKKLDLSGNPIGERGTLAIAEMLKNNTTLEELILRDDEIDYSYLDDFGNRMDEFGNKVDEFSHDMDEDGYSVDEIGIKGIKALVESLAINQHLKKLIISKKYENFLTSSLPLYNTHKERVLLDFHLHILQLL